MKIRALFYAVIFFPFAIAGLSSCTQIQFQRHWASGYDEWPYRNRPGSGYFRQKYDSEWNTAREELGYSEDQPLTSSETRKVELRVELHRLENSLQTDEARKQYYSLKPYFQNDAQRVYFLNLPSLQARQKWAEQQGISSSNAKVGQSIEAIIKKDDIAMGMTAQEVEESWGEPTDIEYAGNPMYQNERWSYTKQISTKSGYQKETRIVYFEYGRVAGWQTL